MFITEQQNLGEISGAFFDAMYPEIQQHDGFLRLMDTARAFCGL